MRYDLKLSTIIDARSAGKSLAEAISDRFSYHSYEYWLEKIAAGLVLVNGCPAEIRQVLQLEDRLDFTVPDFAEPDIDCNYQTVFRNDYLLLVNKPAGLPVHSTRRFYYQTLVAEIRRREGFTDINPLQRLDRETGGLMFLSRTSLVPRRFHRNFSSYLRAKFYLAVVRGVFTHEKLEVDAPLRECMTEPVRYKMIVSAQGKPARTEFFRLGMISAPISASLLLIRLHTGRKHQIRAHLQHIGHSLIGEKLYCEDSKYFLKRCEDNLTAADMKELGSDNHLLHAYACSTEFPGAVPTTFYARETSFEFASFLNHFPNWEVLANRIIEAAES